MDTKFHEYIPVYTALKNLKAQDAPMESEEFKAALRQDKNNWEALEEKSHQVQQSYETYSEQTIASYQKLMADFRLASVGVGLLAVLLGIIVFYLTYRSIVPPIKSMTKTMAALARWDLSVAIPASSYHDEIEAMGEAVQVFKENAIKLENLHRDLKQATFKAGSERKEALRSMADKFEESVKDVAMIMQIAVASEKTARANEIARMLSEAAAKISGILILLNDIAGQTDTLAAHAAPYAPLDGAPPASGDKVQISPEGTRLASWAIGDQARAVQEETKRALNAIHDVATTIDKLRALSSDIARGTAEEKSPPKG